MCLEFRLEFIDDDKFEGHMDKSLWQILCEERPVPSHLAKDKLFTAEEYCVVNAE